MGQRGHTRSQFVLCNTGVHYKDKCGRLDRLRLLLDVLNCVELLIQLRRLLLHDIQSGTSQQLRKACMTLCTSAEGTFELPGVHAAEVGSNACRSSAKYITPILIAQRHARETHATQMVEIKWNLLCVKRYTQAHLLIDTPVVCRKVVPCVTEGTSP